MFQQDVLGHIGILELVDQDVLITPSIPGPDIGVLLEQRCSPKQQIIKIYGIAGEQ